MLSATDFAVPFGHLVTHPDLPLAHRVRYPRTHNGWRPPVLILLHDVGGQEMDLASFGFEQDDQLMVILARAPIQLQDKAFAWFHSAHSAGAPVIQAEEAETARQTLIDFINVLPRAYGCDPRQVYLAGFSQGGSMSAGVALTRPDKVAGFGLFCGRILPEIAPLVAGKRTLARLPAFVAHGQEDAVVPVGYARDAQHMLSSRAVQLAYREYYIGHNLSPAMQRDFSEWLHIQLRIRQLGHDRVDEEL